MVLSGPCETGVEKECYRDVLERVLIGPYTSQRTHLQTEAPQPCNLENTLSVHKTCACNVLLLFAKAGGGYNAALPGRIGRDLILRKL